MDKARLGISVNGVGAIEVGPIPEREQLALYEVVGGEIRVLAWLKIGDAERVVWWLRRLAETTRFHVEPDAPQSEGE